VMAQSIGQSSKLDCQLPEIPTRRSRRYRQRVRFMRKEMLVEEVNSARQPAIFAGSTPVCEGFERTLKTNQTELAIGEA